MWRSMTNERENNRHVNREAFAAFRTIEAACLDEPIQHTTVRCERVHEAMQSCFRDPSAPCGADEYYGDLKKAGFDLPPFYEAGYIPQ